MHLTVVPQLSGVWQNNYSTKPRKAGHANEQSIYSPVVYGQSTFCGTLLDGLDKTIDNFTDVTA